MPKKEFVEWAYDAYRRRMQELGQNLRRGSGTPVSDIKCVITESNATIDKLLADVPSEIACAVKERVFVEI